MKNKMIWLVVLLAISCAPQPQATPRPDTPVTSPPINSMTAKEPNLNSLAPKSGDENLTRGNVYVDEASPVIRESFPPQVSLSIGGNLPTPCNKLRVKIDAPNQENKIMVEVYSLVDPSKSCIQTLKPFQEYIDLGTFSTGHYSVWVNGELAGEFDT